MREVELWIFASCFHCCGSLKIIHFIGFYHLCPAFGVEMSSLLLKLEMISNWSVGWVFILFFHMVVNPDLISPLVWLWLDAFELFSVVIDMFSSRHSWKKHVFKLIWEPQPCQHTFSSIYNGNQHIHHLLLFFS